MLSEKETYELFKERVPRRVIDLFLDIGAGICYAQKQSDSLDGSYDLSRVKHYEPKTILPELIQCCLTESNYGESYKWKHDNEFRTDGYRFQGNGLQHKYWRILPSNHGKGRGKDDKKVFNRMVGE